MPSPMPRSVARTVPRVFVTGLGPISAYGVGIDAMWAGFVEGRSAIRPIGRWDASGFMAKGWTKASAATSGRPHRRRST